MFFKSRREWTEERKEIKKLLQNKDNKKWFHEEWTKKAMQGIGVLFTVWSVFQGSLGISIQFWQLVLLFIIICFVSAVSMYGKSKRSIREYLHKIVKADKPGCYVEIRVADSFQTNAFKNYPKAAMLIGLNKAFWFQEAEPGSIVADLWKPLEDLGIDKQTVQKWIDEALASLRKEKGNTVIDEERPKVMVRIKRDETEVDKPDFVERDNYKIGTVLGIDLKIPEMVSYEEQPMYRLIPKAISSDISRRLYDIRKATTFWIEKGRKNGNGEEEQLTGSYEDYFKKPPLFFKEYLRKERIKKVKKEAYSRKLFFIANAEVVQGADTTEQIKVSPDRNVPVATTFENIWTFFEQKEELGVTPPKSWLYQPLLIPLIGAGVANEGFTDLEIFSTLVDLYYKHLRVSASAGKRIAIPQMIINIRNTTAIKHDTTSDGTNRTIDIETAFWYLDYRNQVDTPKQRKAEEEKEKPNAGEKESVKCTLPPGKHGRRKIRD